MAKAGTPWQHVMEKVEQRCGYLLTSGQWSDCTFVVGSETNQAVAPAHKLILAMASPVFEAMFYGGLSERNEQIVPVPDVQPEAFRALLQYIYTGNINIGSFDMAWDLWYGAKKYMLPQLVKECISYIRSVLGPSNVCRAYEFARFFDEETLVAKCIQIISTNTKEVLNDSSFEDVELNTLITVLSLDHLTVDSELDLIGAVTRYAEVEKKKQKQISPLVDNKLLKELFELRAEPPTPKENELLHSVGSSSQKSPATELDPKPPTEMVTSEPIERKLDIVYDKPTIRAAIEKIRFLSLTPQQFAECPACCGLLTETESFAVIMNIASADSPVPMPTGFSKCRERRQPPSDSVREKLNTQLLVKPSTRGVSGTKLTSAAAILQGLTSSCLNTLQASARAAHEMFTSDSPQIIAQLLEGGVIPPLVAALDHPSSDLQLDAVCALKVISSGTREHTLAIVDAGAIPKLIALIGHGGDGAAQAAGVLGNIACEGSDTRDTVLNHGALLVMLPHMHPDTPLARLRSYVLAYCNLCRHSNPIVRFDLVSPALSHITELLTLTDEEVLANACSAISDLSLVSTNERIESLQVIPGLTQRLIALLRYPAPKVQNLALSVLGTMLTGTDVQTDRCIEAGCLDHLIYFLNCGTAPRVKEAAWAVSNILAGTHPQIQEALDKQILEPLRKVLAEGNAKCQKEAAWAISNLCANGTTQQLDVLVSSGVLEPFCLLLSTPDKMPLPNMLEGLSSLLQKVVQYSRVALCEKMRAVGVPQLLTTLQQHKDDTIRRSASSLLQAHFPGAVPANNRQGT